MGLAGEGGGRGHRNFLLGVLAGDGAIPEGRGLENGLAVAETELECRVSSGMGEELGRLPPEITAWLLTSETLLLQWCPMGKVKLEGRR